MLDFNFLTVLSSIGCECVLLTFVSNSSCNLLIGACKESVHGIMHREKKREVGNLRQNSLVSVLQVGHNQYRKPLIKIKQKAIC